MCNTLNFHPMESKIFMPNELFQDLSVLKTKGSNHITFAYSFYYLISWLYRFAKYDQFHLTIRELKEILGYNKTYGGLDYIIKKGGVLDQIGYTSHANNYPIAWEYDTELKFTLLNELDNETQSIIKSNKSRKYSIKLPAKGFYRNKDSDYFDGTFYEVDRTHLIPFEAFKFSMSKKELGCTGFYLWSYLKMRTQQFENGYDSCIDDLSVETMIPRSTLLQYLVLLREYRMITCDYNQNFFSFNLLKEERKANTYRVNDFEEFSDLKLQVTTMKFIGSKK
ncbi:hypothetical protein LCM23_06335 [Cytobacillus kochii]|uniref:hypothetical protein n=1 Tax=Cytobacillus kochii TaxID=859143 RepID=UPI001CD25583|nr:hypothetical protein [Cytobacillus kochii]MCA1025703.1 hypothetical protein [Cytobacillus kochii]